MCLISWERIGNLSDHPRGAANERTTKIQNQGFKRSAEIGHGSSALLLLHRKHKKKQVLWKLSRVFLNLWFAKPMVWVRVAFHENDRNHENDEDNSDSYKQGVECWIRGNHGNHENDENHENPGATHGFPKPQV